MPRELPEIQKDVGKRIAFFRLKMTKKTQEDFASEIGMSASYLCQLESGKRNPTIQKLFCISAALKIDVGEFFKL